MLEELTVEQADIMWQIYLVGCRERGETPDLSDWLVWLDERS